MIRQPPRTCCFLPLKINNLPGFIDNEYGLQAPAWRDQPAGAAGSRRLDAAAQNYFDPNGKEVRQVHRWYCAGGYRHATWGENIG
ncbi:MAG: hypothetical protein PVJ84_10355 [Desulfobacteraceae bacterium]